MSKVFIRRQFNDFRVGEVDFSSLTGIHWDTISGGVQNIAPQHFIHAYVWCNEVEGEIAHSGIHGPCPHNIKVVILKIDNTPIVWKEILEAAGPRPEAKIKRSKPYKADNDAREIVEAILEGKDHPAIETKRGFYVIKPKKIPRIVDSTKWTALRRGKKLQLKISNLMASHKEFKETRYGNYLAFKKVDQPEPSHEVQSRV